MAEGGLLECVPNLSEGRDAELLGRLARAAGPSLLDVHSDPWHNRSVFTMAGPELKAGIRELARQTVMALDLDRHRGAHPRFGALDVVPFVPLEGFGTSGSGGAGGMAEGDGDAPAVRAGMAEALRWRDEFARWAGEDLGVPCFLYGPERGLPEVRRRAFRDLKPDTGPDLPRPGAGTMAVGARPVMVAYNLWLSGQDAAFARRLAGRLRGSAVRALGFDLEGRAQLSFNLLDPLRTGPAEVYDRAVALGARIERAETVGLVPGGLLDLTPMERWAELDLRPSDTIEARLERRPGPG